MLSGCMWRGLSLRGVAEVLGELGFRVSHQSVRGWFLRAGEAFSLVDRRRRGPIVIRNLVRRAYLWAAREVMAVQVSRGRGIAECIRFLEVVRDRCANNPTVYTDRAPWYRWPMKILGFRRRVETFGRRNAIESWFSKLKRRIKQFNTCSPTYRPKVSEKWIRSWVALS
ncbi:MAG: hypothetical protein QXM16_00835 [Nitrososphaerota archaeon]